MAPAHGDRYPNSVNGPFEYDATKHSWHVIGGGGGGLGPGGSVVLPSTSLAYQVLRRNAANNAMEWSLEGVRGIPSEANVAIGVAIASPWGCDNTAVGWAAMRNATGSVIQLNNNTAIGNNALSGGITMSGNTAIGSKALVRQTQSYATAVGNNALGHATNAYNSTAIGTAAGYGSANITDAQNSVFIGQAANPLGDNQSNQIVIGANATGSGSNTVTLGNASILATNGLFCRSTTIVQPSDARLKENIESADLNKCIEAVRALPVRRFSWNEQFSECTDKHVTGWIAQDVEKVFPKSVVTRDEEFNGVMIKDCKHTGMSEALPTLWAAVQRMLQKIEELEKEVSELKTKH